MVPSLGGLGPKPRKLKDKTQKEQRQGAPKQKNQTVPSGNRTRSRGQKGRSDQTAKLKSSKREPNEKATAATPRNGKDQSGNGDLLKK